MSATQQDRILGNNTPVAINGGYENAKYICKIVLAIVLPPLGVLVEEGVGKHFWINLVLTVFGYIPGILHALWVVLKR